VAELFENCDFTFQIPCIGIIQYVFIRIFACTDLIYRNLQ
jgi:hypothetical protein